MIKISIITISYNSEKTIESTIKSVINQNYNCLEYIVIDGGSTDRTLEIVEKYRNHISIFVSEPDKGISDAFNKGVMLATGDLIGLINSDDFLCENALNNIDRMYDELDEADVYYGNCVSFTDKGRDNYVYKPGKNLSEMSRYLVVSHPATFIKKSAYEKYGLYSLDYKCAMDFELLSKMYIYGAKFQYMDINTTCFRLGGVSGKQLKKTCQESIQIATRNGLEVSAIRKWYKRIYAKQKVLTILKHLHIEQCLRRIIKKQETVQEDLFWFDD